MIQFKAFNPFIRQMRTDRGWRVEFDVSQDQYETIRELPVLQEQVLVVTVHEDAEHISKVEESEEETKSRLMRMLHAKLSEVANASGHSLEDERDLLKGWLIQKQIIKKSMKELDLPGMSFAIQRTDERLVELK